ncbi:MAG: hypothetical protein NC548_29760 [Lachnospiraceae bacterium]|nr:hypothetical protein [Lachnospiraceae bacterium]
MTRDYSSIYGIEDWLVNEVAPKFFPNIDSVSMANIGLFGMITHTTGMVIEDAFNVTARYLNESILSRATLPDFIYAYAASYGITNIFGTPAKMPMFLTIKEADVLAYSKVVSRHREFRIDADVKIYVDSNDLIFSIPYDIVIRTTEFKNEYAHTAVYDTNHRNDLISGNTSPYIKMLKERLNGENWLALRVDVYQYERKRHVEPVVTNNLLNIAFIDIPFSNKLANFELFYEAPDGTDLVQLDKLMDTSPAKTSPFVYYKMLDDNTIRFSFANDDRYFLPVYNSKIHIFIYETQGKFGDFDWKVEQLSASPVPGTEDESIAYNRNMYMDGQILGKSTGGRDQLTLEEIKALALERQITINSYTTERDLNLHFLNTLAIEGLTAIFVKHRDDPAGREYGCFTRIGDGTDFFPTNTLDLRLQTNQCDDRFDNLHQFILKPGARLGYADDKTLNTLVVLNERDPEQEIEYRTMNLMVVGLKSNNVRSYMNSLDNDVELNYDYMNADSPFNFMVGNCHIYRNALRGESKYRITINVARVDGIIRSDTGEVENQITMDPTKLHILLMFNTTIGHYINMEQLSYNEELSMFEFVGYAETNDMITEPRTGNNKEDCKISITNLRVRKTSEVDSRTVEIVNPDIVFAVFYDYGDETLQQGHQFTEIELVEHMTLCNTYSPVKDSFYFAYPMSLMRCHVIFQDEPASDDGYSFLIKQVPVVGKYFLDVDENASAVFNAIIYQHRVLQEVIPLITESYTIIMKFYNTYGRSRLFSTIDSKGASRLLNHVNCKVRLKVKFFDGVLPEDYVPEVQKFTKTYLESVNNTIDEGLNEFHVSVLMQKLHDEYEQIDYILFESVNGYDSSYQTIIAPEKINESTAPTVVPEYLTIYASDVIVTPL